MKYCGRMLVCVLVGVAINAGAMVSVSIVKDGPYRAIGRRNLFGLVPMVNSPTEVPASIIPRPRITLAGTTTLLGYKTAFLMLSAAKGGARECLLLREGETQEEIHVRTIGDNEVKVVNHGEEQTLIFDNPAMPAGVPVPIVGPVGQLSPIHMPPAEQALTPEQQLLVIEAQRLKAMQDGDPIAKILPPTEVTPEITGEAP